MEPPALGFRGQPDREDMSDYLVHLTRDVAGKSAVDNSLAILGDRCVRPGPAPFGFAKRHAASDATGSLRDRMRAVCLTETPLDLLQRFITRRSRFGLGFRREFVAARGGVPVWLPDKGTPVADMLNVQVDALAAARDFTDALWNLAPFIDIPGEYGGRTYRFEWEREWRVRGELAFEPSDVALLLLPEDYHGAARSFFEFHEQEGTGPAYLCKYIDPAWPPERIRAVLTPGPAT